MELGNIDRMTVIEDMSELDLRGRLLQILARRCENWYNRVST